MYIEWKKYQEYIEFKSGECSVIFDTKGNTFLKAGKDFISKESVYFKKHGKEVMRTIMFRAIPQMYPDAIKNPMEIDIIQLKTWKKETYRYPAINKRIAILLDNFKKEFNRLVK